MPTVSAAIHVSVAPDTAERLWYDTGRWSEWVLGLEEVVAVDPGWPQLPGASVTWRSNPAGRGRVSERVIEHHPLTGQRLAVSDDRTEGEQTIAFAPGLAPDGGVELTLTVAFRRHRRGPLSSLVDLLFSRGAMADTLAGTLERFAAVAELEPGALP